jgi:segregation and condensation protein B
MEDIKNIIESLLFVSEDPLTIANIKNVLDIEDPKEIRAALQDLTIDYERRNGAFLLHEVAGGYQIRTRPEYNQWIKRLIQPKAPRLSKAALETLAIIAYKQPIIRSDVEHIRGVDCGGVIRILLERKLVRVLGRKEIPGRPLIYGTTKQFLEVFDLKNLRDLPTPKEIEELRASAGESTGLESEKQSTDSSSEEDSQPEEKSETTDTQPEETISDADEQTEGNLQTAEPENVTEEDGTVHSDNRNSVQPDNEKA